MSCVFYHNEDQKSAALSILSKRAMKRRVVTLIEPATDFYEVCVLSDQVSDSENLMGNAGGGIPSKVAVAASAGMAAVAGSAGRAGPRGLAGRRPPQRVRRRRPPGGASARRCGRLGALRLAHPGLGVRAWHPARSLLRATLPAAVYSAREVTLRREVTLTWQGGAATDAGSRVEASPAPHARRPVAPLRGRRVLASVPTAGGCDAGRGAAAGAAP